MYVPGHFRLDDLDRIHGLVNGNPFGILLTNGESIPEVTHLPMLLRTHMSGDRILGHFALANPHEKKLQDGQAALAVFSGVHGYISPRWYVDPDLVPTWNYLVVHANGTVRRIEDEDALMELVDALSVIHETGREEPWKADWSNPKVSGMLKSIVGFELHVECWECKAKLGQNRTISDNESMKQNLKESGNEMNRQLAAEME